MRMRIKARKLPTLDELFERDDDLLVSPNTGAWRPALVAARRLRDNERILVKYWQKAASSIDDDLRELWRRETRHAERLRVRPGADELLVPVIDAAEARDAFYVVMPGEWIPLQFRQRDCRPEHWLRNLHKAQHRQVLWQNVGRLIQALDVMHGQRVLHGGLNAGVIFTATDHEADFRIGGFEWCFHIGDAKSGPQQKFAASLTDDFASIGEIVAHLLGIPGGGVGHGPTDRLAALELSGQEQALLRALMNPIEHGHFDRRRLGELLAAVEKDFMVAGWGERRCYVLAAQLDSTALQDAIGAETDWQVRRGDRQGQLAYIAADLSPGSQIVRKTDGEVWALGQSLGYRLLPAGPTDKPWQAAVFRYARTRETLPFDRSEPQPLPTGVVEVINQASLSGRLAALGARAGDWSALFGGNDGSEGADDDIRLGMLLTEVALTLSTAAEAIPVTIVAKSDEHVWLRAEGDNEFDELRAALKINPSVRRMQAIFELEEGDRDGAWVLRSTAAVGAQQNDPVIISFVQTDVRKGDRRYRFRVAGRLPTEDFMYLSKSTDRNPHAVVHRRLRLLSALTSQKELLRTLGEPESTLRDNGRAALEDDDALKDLDPSKRDALRTIWRRTPLQAVVGPPGVGKTHLLADYVRRNLDEDPGRRILVAAQGHQALDNAGKAVNAVLKDRHERDELIVVRSRAERSVANKDLYASAHVRGLIKRIAGSKLAARAPQDYRDALDELSEASSTGKSVRKSMRDRSREVRSLETTVMQSATVLLSTTNSGELSRLVESGAVFDEVIIEEAAKATGTELLAPMLLSMQRLLIGDHKQLPAFDSERLCDLLLDVGRVAKVLGNSEALVGSFFRDHGLEELLEIAGNADRLARVCAKARNAVRLFESLVLRDEDRSRRYPRAPRLTVELTEQRRMHPVICDVVSNVFYNKRLTTSAAAQQEFAQTPFPVMHTSGVVPTSPIIWIDLPYVQVEQGAAEETPTFHNPKERKAVLAVLEQVRAAPGPKAPSLAVLSPYLRQADRLVHMMADRAGALKHLSAFRPASTSGAWVGTVDSFQGSEADLVIISLVRNNGDFGRSALGFLSDPRRMGVLLSRARRQMILVGSYGFFCAQARRYDKATNRTDGAGCIPDLMDHLSALANGATASQPTFSIVPASRLLEGRP